MNKEWRTFRIVYTYHADLRLEQRKISKEIVEKCLMEEKRFKMSLYNKVRKNWECYFRISSKYYLKVAIDVNEAQKQLKIITTHIINKKKLRKAERKWLKNQK